MFLVRDQSMPGVDQSIPGMSEGTAVQGQWEKLCVENTLLPKPTNVGLFLGARLGVQSWRELLAREVVSGMTLGGSASGICSQLL